MISKTFQTWHIKVVPLCLIKSWGRSNPPSWREINVIFCKCFTTTFRIVLETKLATHKINYSRFLNDIWEVIYISTWNLFWYTFLLQTSKCLILRVLVTMETLLCRNSCTSNFLSNFEDFSMLLFTTWKGVLFQRWCILNVSPIWKFSKDSIFVQVCMIKLEQEK